MNFQVLVIRMLIAILHIVYYRTTSPENYTACQEMASKWLDENEEYK